MMQDSQQHMRHAHQPLLGPSYLLEDQKQEGPTVSNTLGSAAPTQNHGIQCHTLTAKCTGLLFFLLLIQAFG